MAQHTHVTMELDDGRRLMFQDTRKFGPALVGDRARRRFWRIWGPEPFDPAFTTNTLARLQNRTASIKALLLDQSIVAGVGNIYADGSPWPASQECGHGVA